MKLLTHLPELRRLHSEICITLNVRFSLSLGNRIIKETFIKKKKRSFFFQNCAIHFDILKTYLLHYLKSFNHEHLYNLRLYTNMSSEYALNYYILFYFILLF